MSIEVNQMNPIKFDTNYTVDYHSPILDDHLPKLSTEEKDRINAALSKLMKNSMFGSLGPTKTPEMIEQELQQTYPTYKKAVNSGNKEQAELIRRLLV